MSINILCQAQFFILSVNLNRFYNKTKKSSTYINNLQNNNGDQYRYSQDSTSDESRIVTNFVMKSTSIYVTKFSNNTYKLFRTASIYGTIKKKIKNRICRQTSLTKNSNPNKGVKNRDSKIVRVTKIITAHIQPKSKSTNISSHKKIGAKTNFSTKKQSSSSTKEKSPKVIKLPIKNSSKKSSIYAKKMGSKKLQGPQKANSRNAGKASSKTSYKQKNKNTNTVSKKKGKKEIAKSNYKSPKKSSSTKIWSILYTLYKTSLKFCKIQLLYTFLYYIYF